MTPSLKYRAILRDVEHFLHDRAQRYFAARYAGEAEDLLKVQCDTIMVVLKTHLEPHVMWFEEYEETVVPVVPEPPGLRELVDPSLDADVLGGDEHA